MEKTLRQPFLKIHPKDNVVVALSDLAADTPVYIDNVEFLLRQPIAAKHKFFIHDMFPGDEVIMYGSLVGKIQSTVEQGSLMTTGNTKHAATKYSYRNIRYEWQAPEFSKFAGRSFMGYHRKDGRVGTANYWLFMPLVFCENRNLDIDRRVPNKDLQPCRQALLNERPTDRIPDRLHDHTAPSAHVQIVLFNRPERYLVSLDDLAKPVDDRFRPRISRRESI